MAWDQLSINRPHLVYLILGGFTSLFMLCSSVIKERLYIGEATVATICGIIFGPHAANLIDPTTWGNVDQITLEFSRIVLVVQCFAVGVELPKAYMEKHWRSVLFLLVPVMTFGWLITSLFLWGLIPSVNWLDSLVIAACVTATDPVLASSVVGKGKFAKRVPKHIRDILSAESGCNDGMAFPFIYLGLYLIKYRPNAGEVIYHWVCFTILYECIFGAVYGFIIGYVARRAIRYAHEKNLIDRESFLVFYFVLALFCAGSGSLLGLDDLLVGFACGVGFSNDGWFTEKTEESHVSNVIDLLLNLAFFVYFGTIIPWEQFNAERILGLSAWRLVVVAVLVLLFRRIPIMLALKPIIPDIKTWREALFCGHFGPMGVGAIFVALLARAELETDSTTPLEVLPEEGFPHLNIIELIWPVTTFLVICSIVVHGSSVAVFTLGKHINTLTLTMSYTQGNDSSWMERLPRIQSRSKSSMSLNRGNEYDSSLNEKLEFPAGIVPRNFLRRQREEDEADSRSSSRGPLGKSRKRGSKYGGPISQSAIAPQRNTGVEDRPPSMLPSDSDTLAIRSEDSPDADTNKGDNPGKPEEEIFEEGDQTVYEDTDGNVLEVEDEDPKQPEAKRIQHERQEAERLKQAQGGGAVQKPEAAELKPDVHGWRKFSQLAGRHHHRDKAEEPHQDRKRVPARAYQYGNTIIVEDEDGEVIRKYDISAPAGPSTGSDNQGESHRTRRGMQRMGSYLGMKPRDVAAAMEGDKGKSKAMAEDDRIRFTVEAGGRRLSKTEFIEQIQRLDPKSRARFVESSNVPEPVKEEARENAKAHEDQRRRESRPQRNLHQSSSKKGEASGSGSGSGSGGGSGKSSGATSQERTGGDGAAVPAELRRIGTDESGSKAGPDGFTLRDEDGSLVPVHDVSGDVAEYGAGAAETAAQRRRREAKERATAAVAQKGSSAVENDDDSEDDGTERVPPSVNRGKQRMSTGSEVDGETAAERRRREGALGINRKVAAESEGEDDEDQYEEDNIGLETSREEDDDEDADEDGGEDRDRPRPGIRFAEVASPTREEPSSMSGRRRPGRRFKG